MIHKHIAKHAKRSHAHVQDHGHKWLWLLSAVFLFILVYPYFSNAQGTGWVTQDICPDWDSSPTYYDCLCETDGETSEEICPIPEEPIDLCPNIDGIQETVPEGQELDSSGECVPVEESEDWITDRLNNILWSTPDFGYIATNISIQSISSTGVVLESPVIFDADEEKILRYELWYGPVPVSEILNNQPHPLANEFISKEFVFDEITWSVFTMILNVPTDISQTQLYYVNAVPINANGEFWEISGPDICFNIQTQEFSVWSWCIVLANGNNLTWADMALANISNTCVNDQITLNWNALTWAERVNIYKLNNGQLGTLIAEKLMSAEEHVFNLPNPTEPEVVRFIPTTSTGLISWIEADYTLELCSQIQTTPECTQPNLSFITPASGAVVWGRFSIVRTWTDGSCFEWYAIDLLDHNNQRIGFWRKAGSWRFQVYERAVTGLDFAVTGQFNNTITFDSTLLAYTWYYTITGIHLSGTTHSGVTYTQDTIYNIYTGWYQTWTYTDYATWYKLRIRKNDIILAESNGTFTIDNRKPILTSLTSSFAPLFNWYVGKAAIMTASFTATEQLTGGTTFTILGTTVTPTSVVQSWSTYSFTVPLNTVTASGSLAFTAHVTDLAGNTGAIYGTSSIILNNIVPAISNFSFATGTASGSINLSWKTNISTRYNLSFSKSGTVGTTYFTGTTYGTSHTYTMTNIQHGHQYPFVITALNNVDNNATLQWTLHRSTTGVLSISLQSSNDILQLSWQAETNLYLQILQNEISKFQSCKAAINFTNQTIPVGNKNITIKIPTITSNSVKQTMLTFLLLFTNKVKEKTTLSQAELNIVADAVNNFLVVIKLVDDDNNNCEQKMSTYYLSQFEQLMNSMSFF